LREAQSERDSSGTTVAGNAREGDGADSPTRGATRAPEVRVRERRSGSPTQKLKNWSINIDNCHQIVIELSIFYFWRFLHK